MAKKSVITLERVKRAAETLREAGKQASVREVRGELGEGSFATINPLLKEVKEEWRLETEAAAKIAAANFPIDLAAAYHANVQRERDAAQASLLIECEDLRVQVAEAEEAFTEAQEAMKEISVQIAEERTETTEKIRGLEITAASLKERVAAVHDDLRQTQNERDSAQNEKAAFAADKTRLQFDLDRAEHGLKEIRTQNSRLIEQVESLQQKLSESLQRAAVAEQQAADSQHFYEEINRRCRTLEEDCRSLQDERRAISSHLLLHQASTAEKQMTGARAAHGKKKSNTPALPVGNDRGKKTKPSNGR